MSSGPRLASFGETRAGGCWVRLAKPPSARWTSGGRVGQRSATHQSLRLSNSVGCLPLNHPSGNIRPRGLTTLRIITVFRRNWLRSRKHAPGGCWVRLAKPPTRVGRRVSRVGRRSAAHPGHCDGQFGGLRSSGLSDQRLYHLQDTPLPTELASFGETPLRSGGCLKGSSGKLDPQRALDIRVVGWVSEAQLHQSLHQAIRVGYPAPLTHPAALIREGLTVGIQTVSDRIGFVRETAAERADVF